MCARGTRGVYKNICIICICIVLFTSNALFLSCIDTNRNAKNQIFSCLFLMIRKIFTKCNGFFRDLWEIFKKARLFENTPRVLWNTPWVLRKSRPLLKCLCLSGFQRGGPWKMNIWIFFTVVVWEGWGRTTYLYICTVPNCQSRRFGTVFACQWAELLNIKQIVLWTSNH